MKKLEELGISPAPWDIDHGFIICAKSSEIPLYPVAKISPYCKRRRANAKLIKEAPNLYECLREAVEYHCQNICLAHGCGCNKNCLFYKWRDAIAKVSG